MLQRIERPFPITPGNDQVADNDVESGSCASQKISGVFDHHWMVPGIVRIRLGEKFSGKVSDLGHQFQGDGIGDVMKENRTGGNAGPIAEKCDFVGTRVENERQVPLQTFVTDGRGSTQSVVVVLFEATGVFALDHRGDAMGTFTSCEKLFPSGRLKAGFWQFLRKSYKSQKKIRDHRTQAELEILEEERNCHDGYDDGTG